MLLRVPAVVSQRRLGGDGEQANVTALPQVAVVCGVFSALSLVGHLEGPKQILQHESACWRWPPGLLSARQMCDGSCVSTPLLSTAAITRVFLY